MEVKSNTVVSLRFVMKDALGEVVQDNMNMKPVQYVHGSGTILPALESAVEGLKIHERKSFSIYDERLGGTFYFDVFIDDVTENSPLAKTPGVSTEDCGPGCCC